MKKLIYVHVPKCAGNSIRAIKTKRIKTWTHNIRKKGYKSYPNSRLYKYISKLIIKHFFHSFTIVRNPWSRVYSSFRYLSTGGNSDFDNQDYTTYIEPYNNFEDFIKNGLRKASESQLHFLSQLFWIKDSNKTIVVDTIIHYENINEGLKVFFNEFSIPFSKLSHENKSHNEDYKNHYNEELIKIVGEIYKEEIDQFNFSY